MVVKVKSGKSHREIKESCGVSSLWILNLSDIPFGLSDFIRFFVKKQAISVVYRFDDVQSPFRYCKWWRSDLLCLNCYLHVSIFKLICLMWSSLLGVGVELSFSTQVIQKMATHLKTCWFYSVSFPINNRSSCPSADFARSASVSTAKCREGGVLIVPLHKCFWTSQALCGATHRALPGLFLLTLQVRAWVPPQTERLPMTLVLMSFPHRCSLCPTPFHVSSYILMTCSLVSLPFF